MVGTMKPVPTLQCQPSPMCQVAQRIINAPCTHCRGNMMSPRLRSFRHAIAKQQRAKALSISVASRSTVQAVPWTGTSVSPAFSEGNPYSFDSPGSMVKKVAELLFGRITLGIGIP
jgi:hypothetical protein